MRSGVFTAEKTVESVIIVRFTRASRSRVTSRVFQRTTIVYLRTGTEFSIFGGVYVSHVWGGVRAPEVHAHICVGSRKEDRSNKKKIEEDTGDVGSSGSREDIGQRKQQEKPPRERRNLSNECR